MWRAEQQRIEFGRDARKLRLILIQMLALIQDEKRTGTRR